MAESEKISITGARVHNLKDIDLEIPRDALVVITGLSGSGKSSLAFDTICAEGQRRYMDTLSAYARQFIGILERPDIDEVKGLSPVISIEQKTVGRNPRSTVGTITEIYDFFRLFYARASQAFSPESPSRPPNTTPSSGGTQQSSSSATAASMMRTLRRRKFAIPVRLRPKTMQVVTSPLPIAPRIQMIDWPWA